MSAPTRLDPFTAGDLAPVPRTLIDILTDTAEHHPDAPAIDDGEVALSYTELVDRITEGARQLAAGGVRPGDRVGIRMPSGSRELYLAILSVLAAGAAYVPVDADDPPERAVLVFGESAVRAVLTADGIETSGSSAVDVRVPGPSDDAWIIFTSGSTGKPKGVAVTHRNAAAFVDAEARLFVRDAPLGPGDRVLAGLSVAFDASCEEMWLAWRHGACLVPAPRSLVRTGMDLGPWLIARSITVVSTVPTLAALWPAEALDSVRLLIFGGEACPPELARRLAVDGREVWNTYGPTEATVVACAAQHDRYRPGAHLAPTAAVEPRTVVPTPRATQWAQIAATVPLTTLTGLQWITWLAVANNILAWASPAPWAPALSWWSVLVMFLVFITPVGRMAIAATGSRLLLRKIAPGTYRRGGSVHLRIWVAERLVEASGAANLSGATWMVYFARALGAKIGRRVDLHTLPPVTGMIELGEGCSIEPETDLSGYWIDGDVIHVGSIVIGAGASVGARSTLFPGARIGAHSEVAPGSAVTGKVTAGQRWAGSPAVKVGKAVHPWPEDRPPRASKWVPVYGLTSLAVAAMPLLALAGGLVLLGWSIRGAGDLGVAVTRALTMLPVATILTFPCSRG